MKHNNHPLILFTKAKGYTNFSEFVKSLLESLENYKPNLPESDRFQSLNRNLRIVISGTRRVPKNLISLLSEKFPEYEILKLAEEINYFNLNEKPKTNLKSKMKALLRVEITIDELKEVISVAKALNKDRTNLVGALNVIKQLKEVFLYQEVTIDELNQVIAMFEVIKKSKINLVDAQDAIKLIRGHGSQ